MAPIQIIELYQNYILNQVNLERPNLNFFMILSQLNGFNFFKFVIFDCINKILSISLHCNLFYDFNALSSSNSGDLYSFPFIHICFNRICFYSP